MTTVKDFHRARFLYQLTHPGEAAERALAVYDEQLDGVVLCRRLR